jgi:hypothetical protein
MRVGSIAFFFGGRHPLVQREGDRLGFTGEVIPPAPVDQTWLAQGGKAQQRREERLQNSQQDGRRDQFKAPLCWR